MFLTSDNTLTLELDGTATTTEPAVVACCTDINQCNGRVTHPALKETATTGATHVHVVSAPSADTIRRVDFLSIRNLSTTASNIFTLNMTGGHTNPLTVALFTLLTLETAIYTPDTGWKCYKADGKLKTNAHAA